MMNGQIPDNDITGTTDCNTDSVKFTLITITDYRYIFLVFDINLFLSGIIWCYFSCDIDNQGIGIAVFLSPLCLRSLA